MGKEGVWHHRGMMDLDISELRGSVASHMEKGRKDGRKEGVIKEVRGNLTS